MELYLNFRNSWTESFSKHFFSSALRKPRKPPSSALEILKRSEGCSKTFILECKEYFHLTDPWYCGLFLGRKAAYRDWGELVGECSFLKNLCRILGVNVACDFGEPRISRCFKNLCRILGLNVACEDDGEPESLFPFEIQLRRECWMLNQLDDCARHLWCYGDLTGFLPSFVDSKDIPGIPILSGDYVEQKRKDHETITRLEAMHKLLYPNSFLNSGQIYTFWKFYGYKTLDLDKTMLKAYFVFLIGSERLRLKELYLRMMIRCLIVFTFFLSVNLEISDRKAKIQEIKANIRDKHYKGNCKAKIGITPDPGGELKVCITPF